MTDRHDPNLILDYVEDQLSAIDRARFEESLTRDPALASLVADMQRDREALRSAPPMDPPAGLADAAMQNLERQLLLDHTAFSLPQDNPATSRWRLAPLLAYSGIAAVLLLTASLLVHFLQSEQPEQSLATERPAFDIAQAPLDAQDDALRQPLGGVADERKSPTPMPARDENAAATPPALSAPEPSPQPAETQTAMAQEAFGGGGAARTSSGRTSSPAEADVALFDEAKQMGELADGRHDSIADGSEQAKPHGKSRHDSGVAAPPVRLNVQTASASDARQKLEDWAMRNNATIAYDSAMAGEPSDSDIAVGRSELAEAIETADAPLAELESLQREGRQQLLMVVEEDRVPDLIAMIDQESQSGFKQDTKRRQAVAAKDAAQAMMRSREIEEPKPLASATTAPASPLKPTQPLPGATAMQEAVDDAPPAGPAVFGDHDDKHTPSTQPTPGSRGTTVSAPVGAPSPDLHPPNPPWLNWLKSTRAVTVEVVIDEWPGIDADAEPQTRPTKRSR